MKAGAQNHFFEQLLMGAKLVSFGKATVGRCDVPTVIVPFKAKAKIHASLQQLLCQGRFAPEPMHSPLCSGAQ